MEIIWAYPAILSLDDIYKYLEEKENFQAIESLENEIERKESLISKNPFLGKRLFEKEEYRSILIDDRNSIIYEPLTTLNKILILYVWDGRQNPDKLLEIFLLH